MLKGFLLWRPSSNITSLISLLMWNLFLLGSHSTGHSPELWHVSHGDVIILCVSDFYPPHSRDCQLLMGWCVSDLSVIRVCIQHLALSRCSESVNWRNEGKGEENWSSFHLFSQTRVGWHNEALTQDIDQWCFNETSFKSVNMLAAKQMLLFFP